MEERMSQLETEVAILKEEMKLVRYLSSNKSQHKVAVGKSKAYPPIGKRKCENINDLPADMMQMVLKKLDTTSLKNCRRVCHKWNLQATPVLANRAEINPENFFPWNSTQQKHILTFPGKITPGLIRNIKANHNVELLTAFLEKYGEQVKGLKILGWFLSFHKNEQNQRLHILYRVFTELCLNLEDLNLYKVVHEDSEHENFTQEQMSFEFSNPLKLKALRVHKVLDSASENSQGDLPPLSSFLKNVMLAAGHLEELEIDAVYCPKDLSNQIALKTLFLMHMQFSQIKQIEFGDGNKLENLIVGVPQLIYTQSKGKRNAKSQRFPALRNLTIKIAYDKVPQSSSNFAYYMLERSPVLEFLAINAYGTVDQVKVQIRDLFHNKSSKSYGQLKTLKILAEAGMEDQAFFESIFDLTNFPNLTTLEFSIGKYASLTDQQKDNKVSKWFEIFSKLKLVHLTINIQCNIKMSKVADGISENSSLFRGLETLKICCGRNGDLDADDLCGYPSGQMAAFQKTLKLTSTLKQAKFVDFEMRGSTLKNLTDFVKKNRLPVTFDYNTFVSEPVIHIRKIVGANPIGKQPTGATGTVSAIASSPQLTQHITVFRTLDGKLKVKGLLPGQTVYQTSDGKICLAGKYVRYNSNHLHK